jgi:DNA-binding cell septation regulator SpoVG
MHAVVAVLKGGEKYVQMPTKKTRNGNFDFTAD